MGCGRGCTSIVPSVVLMNPPVTKGANACAGSMPVLLDVSFPRPKPITASVATRSFVQSVSALDPWVDDDDSSGVLSFGSSLPSIVEFDKMIAGITRDGHHLRVINQALANLGGKF